VSIVVVGLESEIQDMEEQHTKQRTRDVVFVILNLERAYERRKAYYEKTSKRLLFLGFGLNTTGSIGLYL